MEADETIQDYCQSAKAIYCIMERGHGEAVVQELYQQEPVISIDYATGRHQTDSMGQNEWQEMDFLLAVVSPEFADEVFYEMFYLARIDQSENAMIYLSDIEISTTYKLPELPELDAPEAATSEGPSKT